ncbi:MAG: HAMP domain-containing protein [Planctomycetes bacterium]|nr:HAMP domain-containing protein [Planctomycetota bacterium]
MSLRTKVVLVLSLVIGLFVTGDYWVQKVFVLGRFVELEEARAQTTTVRVKKALDWQLELLAARSEDWAKNEETASFLSGALETFEDERMGTNLLDAQDFDLMALCGPKGDVRWRIARDPYTHGEANGMELEPVPAPGLGNLSQELLTGWRAEDRARGLLRPIRGYVATQIGPLMVASQPVYGGADGRRVLGKVVLGRFLAGRFADEIKERTETSAFRAWFHDPATDDAEVATFVEENDGEPLLRPEDDQSLQVLHVVSAEASEAPLIFSATVDRDISSFGRDATRYAFLSMIGSAGLLLLALLTVLQKTVLRPISSLTHNAVRIGQDDMSDVKFELDRADEIGVLSREFDHMMEQLARSRAALVDTARQAGQSEIASGILHNVGNVLNSVNVSSGIVAKETEAMAVRDLEALNGIIAEHAADLGRFLTEDPRGAHLAPFLDALTKQFAQSQAAIAEEVASMSQGIERIRSMVTSQQDYVRRTLVVEQVDLSELVDQALELSKKVQAFEGNLDVDLQLEPLPKVAVDRHRVLEILVNLIQNSRQAMAHSDPASRRLTVRLERLDEDHVALEVTDTGCGIRADHLTRVFDHGFTTKSTGNGFGLHTSANSAKEMGGSLSARSDGPGSGATFRLELPLQSRKTTVPTA